MMPEAHGLALHFEIPAILHRALPQLPVRRDFAVAVLPVCVHDAVSCVVKLGDERLKRPADAQERSETLLVQLSKKLIVALRRALTHAPIVAEFHDGPQAKPPCVRGAFCHNASSGNVKPSSRIVVLVLLVIAGGCGGGRRPVASPGSAPAVTPVAAGGSVQGLYEAGRYREVLSSVSAGREGAEEVWFAAQSNLRLGQREEAARQFARLPTVGASPAWQVVSDLALALVNGDLQGIDRARAAAIAFPSDPFVQFELGLAHGRMTDFAAAAQAFDQCANADPRFAYAYYNAGLAYDRLNRTDLTIIRLEMFVRLAPDAPEQPEVAAILRTVRGR